MVAPTVAASAIGGKDGRSLLVFPIRNSFDVSPFGVGSLGEKLTERVPRKLKKPLFAVVGTVVGLVGLEFCFRAVNFVVPAPTAQRIEEYRNEWGPSPLILGTRMLFSPHAHMVYTYNPALKDFEDEDTFINDLGFFFDNIRIEKTTQTYRIATFGGSTTGGHQGWPFWLEQQLNEQFDDQRVEVLNFGVAGWTSAEGPGTTETAAESPTRWAKRSPTPGGSST